MLAQLLDSLLVLESPAGATLQVIVVENASKPTLNGLLTRYSNAMEVAYQTEPQLGIPFARNRVLAISLENGCDCTAFVDDDERADPALVKNLYAAPLPEGFGLGWGAGAATAERLPADAYPKNIAEWPGTTPT
jgi:glycosyltransferase involved in cell wall biosynthesis